MKAFVFKYSSMSSPKKLSYGLIIDGTISFFFKGKKKQNLQTKLGMRGREYLLSQSNKTEDGRS